MDSRAGWGSFLWAGGLVGAFLSLLRLGRLEWMTIDWSDPWGWLDAADMEVAVAVVARIGGLVVLGWIGVGTIVYAFARGLAPEARSLDWLSIPPLRRAVDAVLAGSLLLGSVVPAGAVVEDRSETPPAAPTSAWVDPRYVPVPAGSHGTGPAASRTAAEDHPRTARVVVRSGDHFWGLSAQRLEEALGREPTLAEVASYWRDAIEANRAVIRSGDPDLIFPGEEIVLPPPPAA